MVVQYMLSDVYGLLLRAADGRTVGFVQGEGCYSFMLPPDRHPWPDAGLAEVDHQKFSAFYRQLQGYHAQEVLASGDVELRNELLRSVVPVKEPRRRNSLEFHADVEKGLIGSIDALLV